MLLSTMRRTTIGLKAAIDVPSTAAENATTTLRR
jgi:hypothetical protein